MPGATVSPSRSIRRMWPSIARIRRVAGVRRALLDEVGPVGRPDPHGGVRKVGPPSLSSHRSDRCGGGRRRSCRSRRADAGCPPGCRAGRGLRRPGRRSPRPRRRASRPVSGAHDEGADGHAQRSVRLDQVLVADQSAGPAAVVNIDGSRVTTPSRIGCTRRSPTWTPLMATTVVSGRRARAVGPAGIASVAVRGRLGIAVRSWEGR